jgi:hypothetical protein
MDQSLPWSKPSAFATLKIVIGGDHGARARHILLAIKPGFPAMCFANMRGQQSGPNVVTVACLISGQTIVIVLSWKNGVCPCAETGTLSRSLERLRVSCFSTF